MARVFTRSGRRYACRPRAIGLRNLLAGAAVGTAVRSRAFVLGTRTSPSSSCGASSPVLVVAVSCYAAAATNGSIGPVRC